MINLFVGVMGSGKSEHLIDSYLNFNNYIDVDHKPLLFSNSGIIESRANVIKLDSFSLQELLNLNADEFNEDSYIFIDEFQFLTDKEVNKVVELSENANVFCYGLTHDYKNEMYSSVAKLIQYASNIYKFDRLCEVCELTQATHHIKQNPKIDIDKSNYKTVCEKCWEEHENA